MISELTEKLMRNIGLDIDDKCRVIDQDFGNLVLFDGRTLKCSYNNQEPFIGRNDIYFDPLNNIKLMCMVFSYFLNKHSTLNDTYFISFAQINDEQNNKSCLDLRGDSNIISNYYKSETLKYVDIIFKLSGYDNVDFLGQYDTKVR